MCKKTTFCIRSKVDQLPLHGIMMVPVGKPRGMIQFVHGMAEHKERYFEVMDFYCRQGFVCVIHDHRGHGESVRQKKDLGYFYNCDEMAIVSDVKQVLDYAKKQHPKLKIVLLGHSMGSLVVRVFTKRYDDAIDGLIVSGSPSENKASNAGLWLAKGIAKVKGDHYVSKVVDQITFAGYQKGFDKKKGKFVWLCSDEAIVKAYEKDDLCGFIFTLNGFIRLYRLMLETYSKKGWQFKQPQLPILFLAGKKDPCIQSESKFLKAQQYMKQIGYDNVSGKCYEGMHHEILNETKKQVVYKDILAWIEKLL